MPTELQVQRALHILHGQWRLDHPGRVLSRHEDTEFQAWVDSDAREVYERLCMLSDELYFAYIHSLEWEPSLRHR